MKNNLLIIIPAYNEEDTIKQTVLSIIQLQKYDYIVINDGSTDRTKKILEQHQFNHINLPINLGIGGAMQTGYLYASRQGYDYAIQLDADGQHNPKDLEKLLHTIQDEPYDMVIGSRFVERTNYKGSFFRRIGIQYFYYLIRFITGVKIFDPTSGYRIVNKDVIREFARYYPIDYPEVEVLVMLSGMGYRFKEVSVDMNKRQGGISSISPVRSVYYMLKVSYFSIVRALFKNRMKTEGEV